ncbi:ABC transporter ATP-binding protein [Hyphococcus luteus]|jgi:phospholipid/cholesterol/gamma-HCH transport system ATP-binding protein|uniref:ABC transporter ATP-binding protein n=1 Tax=Hyphococcus luteus TaxID=2058213 RepID=A0A2S7JZK5_9PROT|nr:ATP-binding cassette domain-containing protein [Marinicaulis flavus]PQA85670.1 ABC transporter ATP-binding protein [Marinicaulis flavus]
MSETTPAITVRDLHKGFDSNQVLRGVDLDVNKGRSLVVIGGSGTGKSVLLKCIIGLMKPDRGSIEVDGRNISRHSDSDRRYMTQLTGMLFQGSALFDSLKVWENVAFRLLNAERKPRKEAREKAIECLAQVGLAPEVGDLQPAALSGGMQKRVSLARAIASDPHILFFDEPTTGLDPIMADVINNLIVDRVKALGATAVSITHDMASARKIADEIAMLYQGRIIWRGSPDEIENSGNPMVDQFVHGRAEGPIKMAVRKS